MPKAIKITLAKSLIAQVPKNVKTAHALGIRKIGQSTLNHPTPSILGMVHQIKHLVTVEEVEVDEIPRKRRNPKAVAAPIEVAAEVKPKKTKSAKTKTEE
ncbi:MAG: 50S ribosomal protein L30 [Fimbriimonadaceae bacterium]|jgi:large subunit ribosomal protein L30|nr:50S ribosomal protein L30 [Fimbriimonadaceae bacterium]